MTISKHFESRSNLTRELLSVHQTRRAGKKRVNRLIPRQRFSNVSSARRADQQMGAQKMILADSSPFCGMILLPMIYLKVCEWGKHLLRRLGFFSCIYHVCIQNFNGLKSTLLAPQVCQFLRGGAFAAAAGIVTGALGTLSWKKKR